MLAAALLLFAATPPLAEIDHAIEAGRIDQARMMIARAIEADGNAARFDRSLARAAFRSRAWDDALARYARLAEQAPTDAQLVEPAGLAALAAGKDDLARSYLGRAQALAGASWRTWNGLGVLADRDGDHEGARVHYARALALAPGQAAVLNNLGWSHFLAGDPATALPLLERARAADPDARLYADNVELVGGALAGTLPERRKDESDDAFAARLNDAGVVARMLGQDRKARAAFAQAITLRGTWYQRAANNLKLAGGAR